MAIFEDTEKRKGNNYKKTQSIASLRSVNNYVSRDDKVGDITIERMDNLVNKDNEELVIENLINKKSDAIFNYVTQDSKTKLKLITGINCRPSSAFDEMMLTKRMFNKVDGRQFKHFVHSYSNKETNLTPEVAHEITLKLLEDKKFKDFQILVATHIDTEHIHSHIVINSVNMETGRKWNHSLGDLFSITELSNKLCDEYGLKHSIVNTKSNKFIKNRSMSSGEYRAKKEGRSWKTEAFYAIDDCRKTSISKEDFIKKLDTLGYKVRWEESRKNITFTLPNGRKLNNDKLHPAKNFTKEALLKRFKLNSQYKDIAKKYNPEKQFNEREELILQTVKMLDSNPNEGNKDYPRSYLENNKQSIKELMAEKSKGEGLDWDKEKER